VTRDVLVVLAGRAVVGVDVVVGSVVTIVETVVGGSLKTTPGLVTVVAGAGGTVVAAEGEVVRGCEVTVVVAAGVDVVVELLEVVEVPAALRSSVTTVDGVPRTGSCIWGRVTFAAG
jgi:hypothetical protein